MPDTVRPFDRYPFLQLDAQAHYLSSFDRSGGNDDGFDGTYSALYVDTKGEHVIFDVKGPGTLFNLWFTSRENGFAPLGWGRLRFYFDDETTPSIDMDADEFFSGRHEPFAPPFVYHNFESSGGYASYMPFPFAKRLKITTQRRVGFYNAYYHTFSSDRTVTTWSADDDRSGLTDLFESVGARAERYERNARFHGTVSVPSPSLPDGESVPSRVTLLEHDGAGVVTSLRMNPLFPLTRYELNHIWVQIFWDGASEPSVNAPLGSFFGSGLGTASVRTLPLGMSPSGAFYFYLPMPFWESFQIHLVNENPEPTPNIWWEVEVASSDAFPCPRERCGTFHAHYRREWPTVDGRDYLLLDASGRGVHVGQVMTVEPLRAEIKRWWEGDQRLFLDGRRQPAFHGTGHEDEYLGGWSNEWLMNPYSLPMHGEPKTAELTRVDFQWSAATTVYRFFMNGIPFQNGIRLSTEHGANNTANAMYSSVAYYYMNPTPMERLAQWEAEGPLSLTSRFEGDPEASELTAQGRRVDDRSTFRFEVPADARHLRLRRLYDQSEIQEAELYVNGKFAGVWYQAATNSHARWAEADFLLPESITDDADSLDIEIRPRRPGWSEFRYELWGLRRDLE
jgi:hypothetical protein